MSSTRSEPAAPDQRAPYGADPHRSKTPVALLSLLYVTWLVLLIWMAATRPGA